MPAPGPDRSPRSRRDGADDLDFLELDGGTIGLRAVGLLGVERARGTQQDDAGGEEPRSHVGSVRNEESDYLSALSPAAGSRS